MSFDIYVAAYKHGFLQVFQFIHDAYAHLYIFSFRVFYFFVSSASDLEGFYINKNLLIFSVSVHSRFRHLKNELINLEEEACLVTFADIKHYAISQKNSCLKIN